VGWGSWRPDQLWHCRGREVDGRRGRGQGWGGGRAGEAGDVWGSLEAQGLEPAPGRGGRCCWWLPGGRVGGQRGLWRWRLVGGDRADPRGACRRLLCLGWGRGRGRGADGGWGCGWGWGVHGGWGGRRGRGAHGGRGGGRGRGRQDDDGRDGGWGDAGRAWRIWRRCRRLLQGARHLRLLLGEHGRRQWRRGRAV
jgi:hypothetical protein